MLQRFAFTSKRFWIVLVLALIAGAPVAALGQDASPEPSPEEASESGYRIGGNSSLRIDPGVEGGVVQQLFQAEVILDPAGTAPATALHLGTIAVTVQSGAVCYTIVEAPAETVSLFVPGWHDPNANVLVPGNACDTTGKPCASICEVEPGAPVLLQAGDSVTHVTPARSGPEDRTGLWHTYTNVSDITAVVLIHETGPAVEPPSCHGGCP